jgi:hypothetical protein
MSRFAPRRPEKTERSKRDAYLKTESYFREWAARARMPLTKPS